MRAVPPPQPSATAATRHDGFAALQSQDHFVVEQGDEANRLEQEEGSELKEPASARISKFVIAGGLAGAVSRTATAPIDRLKMLLQVQENAKLMTLREGVRMMASEGSLKTWFRGNGTNVLKIAPETSMKLALNDHLRHRICADDPPTALERLCFGGISGAVAQGAVYPLDTVRTRLAVCPRSEYGSIHATALRMLRQEGLSSFYRGLTPSMCGVLPYAGTDIALFEVFKEELYVRYGGDPPHIAILAAGMLSATIAQFVSYPLALVRTRLQAQGAGGYPIKYTGMLDVFSRTLRKEGLPGLYKGLLPNLIKLAPAAGISWYVFEATKKALGVDPRS